MERRLPTALLVLALPLAACDRAATPPPGSGADAPPAVATPSGDPAALPTDFILLTNEPFWQARVEGGEVVLSGPDVDGRRFAVTSDGDADGARRVQGRDGAGSVVVTLLPGPCEDSMSGAVFPFAGELTVDGLGPTAGCARPAGTPPPVPPA